MPQIPCRLSHLIVDDTQSVQSVVLKEHNGSRSVHIGIGIYEAMAIQRLLDQEPFPRPLTHDLFEHAITSLGGSLHSLHITTLDDDGTYFAHLSIQRDGTIFDIDCRPSDGLALILRQKGALISINSALLFEDTSTANDENPAE